MTVKKLTSSMLRKIIREEALKGFGATRDVEDVADDTKEVDADEMADALEKRIDYVKALKIEEKRLVKRLMKLREAKKVHLKKIVSTVS